MPMIVFRGTYISAEQKTVLVFLHKTISELHIARERVVAAPGRNIALQVRASIQQTRDGAARRYLSGRIGVPICFRHVSADFRPERLGMADENKFRE